MSSYFQIVNIFDKDFDNPVIVSSEYVTNHGNYESVRYVAPPYSEDDLDFIQDFVMNHTVPPESWPSFRCETKASAVSYREAALLMENYKVRENNNNKNYLLNENTTKVTVTKNISASKKIPISACGNQYIIRKEDVKELLFDIPPLTQPVTKTNIGSSPSLCEAHFSHSTSSNDLEKQRSILRGKHIVEVQAEIHEESSRFTCSGHEPLDINTINSERKDRKRIKFDSANKSTIALERQSVNTSTDETPFAMDITNEIVTKKDLRDFKDSIIHYLENKVTPKIRTLQTDMEELKSFTLKRKPLKELDNILTFSSFQELYSYDIPLQSNEDFQSFDSDLLTNRRDVRTNIKKHFMSIINADSDLVNTVREILKKLIGRNVLLLYTVQKKKNDKLIFKQTIFYQCLRDSLIQSYGLVEKLLEEKTVLHALGIVFNNVKDWDGHRFDRQ